MTERNTFHICYTRVSFPTILPKSGREAQYWMSARKRKARAIKGSDHVTSVSDLSCARATAAT
jgi:hypothetical protein